MGHVVKFSLILGAVEIGCACHADRGSERASRDLGEAVAWWELGWHSGGRIKADWINADRTGSGLG